MIESITPLTSTTQQLGYQSTSNSDIEMGRKKISVTEPKGCGMTKWWMLLSSFTFICTYLPILPDTSNDILQFLRGVCAVSGICVCLGYYTFTIGFNRQSDQPLPLDQVLYTHMLKVNFTIIIIITMLLL